MWSPVACIRLKELPSWTCSRGEWRSANVVSYMFDVAQQRAFSLEAPRCETATQHSYKLRMPCQLSALLTFPPLSFSLMPVKNFQRREKETERCRGWYPSGGWKKERGGSEWQPTLCPSHASPSRTASAVTPATHTYTACVCVCVCVCVHLDHSSKQVPKHDYNLKGGSNTQDNNWLCLLSSLYLRNHSNAAETTVRRLAMQICSVFIVGSRAETQVGPTISTQSAILATQCDWSDTSSADLHNYHNYHKARKPLLLITVSNLTVLNESVTFFLHYSGKKSTHTVIKKP